MAGDPVARRVAQKELQLFFASPAAWLFLASFLAVCFFVFFWVESYFARNIADVRPLFEWMPVLLVFLSAALTMRMWSEERRTGTIEHVLTQPASLWRFVLGKFRACLWLLLLALVATLPLPVSISLLANLDWGPVIAGYLATCLLGACYISAGLFISSRTDNPIVSLIGTVALCGLLYLPGSDTITSLLDNRMGELMRLLGSGSRFESITRGVIDVRDLVYYLGLTIAFLSLNVYSLERQRWSGARGTPRHRRWRLTTGLLLANVLLANVWLQRIDGLRLDLTEGRMYSISEPTHSFLGQLREPLLIRGYFSAKTHPLLAPLVPQLRDLIEEYQVAGKGMVRVEFVDPAEHPDLEREANERFGIQATPFQVADRYQAALVNSYFNILVRYGNEHETLGFSDLIEVRKSVNGPAEVMLRNPEYDITRAIKNVLYNYQMGGSLFDRIDEPVEFIAYVSGDELLPRHLLAYKQSIKAQLDDIVPRSGGKFTVRFIQPEARGGAVARQIQEEWGFRPMVTSLDDESEFFFYLTLADRHRVVQLPTAEFDPVEFRTALDAGLKRFARGFTRTVALSLPPVDEQMARFHIGGPTFSNLEQAIGRSYSILMEDLADGSVAPDADILAVIAPHRLDERALFAIDQFLMRGGTVILASSPYTAEISDGQMRLQDWESGLQEWLAHHGITVGDSLVLDRYNAAMPAPVIRRQGEYDFHDVQMIDYPYFIDLRADRLATDHPVTRNLTHLTMAWASPLEVEPRSGLSATTLLNSSTDSWLSDSMDIMPAGEPPAAEPGQEHRAYKLGIVLQGRFDSFYRGRPQPVDRDRGQGGSDALQGPYSGSLVARSTESARLILFGSNDFMDDQILKAQAVAAGTGYLGAIEVFMNTLDWALQDDELLRVRSRAHFNRTLPPMDHRAQAWIEYLNYGAAVSWLVFLALAHGLQNRLRRRRYTRGLRL